MPIIIQLKILHKGKKHSKLAIVNYLLIMIILGLQPFCVVLFFKSLLLKVLNYF